MLIDETQLEFIHPKLRLIILEVNIEFGLQCITSLYRMNDKGIHGNADPLRALDARCRNEAQGLNIEKWVNDRWIYDPARPQYNVCMFHDTGRGIHLHFQVHDNTTER